MLICKVIKQQYIRLLDICYTGLGFRGQYVSLSPQAEKNRQWNLT